MSTDTRLRIAVLVLALIVFASLVLYGSDDIARYVMGTVTVPPSAANTSSGPARADTLMPLRVTITTLGRPPIAKFVFDPGVADRVVSCSAVSTDGGRTWPALIADVMVRPMVLGGANAVAPVPGPGGRFLCGDMILPGAHVPAVGQGEIHPAAEWDGQAFHAVGLPAASPDYATEPVPTTSVAYTPDGQAIAARGTELLLADARYQTPGDLVAFAMDARGRVVAATRRGRKETDLHAAESLGDPWTKVPAPGIVHDVAAADDRIYVAADLLGSRDADGKWRWTPWPANVQAERLSIADDTVIAWGRLYPAAYHAGVVVLSRDGGATIRFAPLEKHPLWVALDPKHPGELLAILEGGRADRELVRLKIE
jgi:hypothetical protein